MQRTPYHASCPDQFRPDFDHAVYRTSVDVIGKHISGLLIFKQMPDSSTRVVFSNEMGFTFFDFGFLKNNGFAVYQIIPQMNKKALIQTLRKDFDLVMFRNMDSREPYALKDSNLIYNAYPQTKGINYYVTDSGCRHLVKMQRASPHKPVVEAVMDTRTDMKSPDSIRIRHLNFNFSITLIKIKILADP